MDRAIHEVFPELRARLPLHALGRFPTPIDPLPELERALGAPSSSVFVKRDDLSSPVFGGNKVRTLEVFFAAARREGADRVFATGAFGSNHALATVLHAEGAGLDPGVILYPQPPSPLAVENVKAIGRRARRFIALPHWSALPFGIAWTRASERRSGHVPFVMPPGGATPLGTLGYVNAGLELALQIAAGAMPPPRTIVLAGGSGCTTAGLLVGLAVAARLGVGSSAQSSRELPRLVSVRVTPWPVTSHRRLSKMAARTSALLSHLAANPRLRFDAGELGRRLVVDGRFLGRGYGHPTPEGVAAVELLRRAGRDEIEPTYTGKAAAALVDSLKRGERGPTLFWATQSSTRPPDTDSDASVPVAVARWLQHASGASPPKAAGGEVAKRASGG